MYYSYITKKKNLKMLKFNKMSMNSLKQVKKV